MELTNIFEAATRYKYRFPFKGMISVEDLWDLKLQDLDSVFKLLNKEKKQSDEESLLQVKSEADQELENKIQIVKFIVQVKQAETAERLAAKDKKERNQKIMRIIERKQNEALEGKRRTDSYVRGVIYGNTRRYCGISVYGDCDIDFTTNSVFYMYCGVSCNYRSYIRGNRKIRSFV